MYFCGLTKCFTCGASETLRADVPSDWRAIKAEKRLYYFCFDCQPGKTGYATTADWTRFYTRAVEKIYRADFKRPIRRLLILRDVGGNPEIINPNLN